MDTSYEQLKQVVAQSNYTPITMELLKQQFRDVILSPRRLEHITTAAQLVAVLEKRDVINETSFEILRQIVAEGTRGRTAVDPRPHVIPSPVRNVLCDSIGRKWGDFARALDIPENTIDDIEDSCERIVDRVRRILEIFEEYRLPYRALLQALSTIRRNDLQKLAIDYLDTNPSGY